MKLDWKYFKEKLANSPNDIQIFEKTGGVTNPAKGNTAMEVITSNVSFILVNKYLRILGTSESMYENIFDFTNEFREVFSEEKYIVAYDIFGGLFASEKTIHYFSPDNLQWEDLDVSYGEFIEWIAGIDITDFYETFLWNDMDELLQKMKSDEGVFIYPFLWAKECDINTASKKIVPYKDLLVSNFQNMSLLAEEINDID